MPPLASKWPALVSFSFLKKKPGKGCEATSGLQMACAGFFFISEKETSKGCEARAIGSRGRQRQIYKERIQTGISNKCKEKIRNKNKTRI
jgi:hypothetical protein